MTWKNIGSLSFGLATAYFLKHEQSLAATAFFVAGVSYIWFVPSGKRIF